MSENPDTRLLKAASVNIENIIQQLDNAIECLANTKVSLTKLGELQLLYNHLKDVRSNLDEDKILERVNTLFKEIDAEEGW